MNSKSNNEKRIIKKNEKMNIFLKLNKDIELFEKKLRGEKFIYLEDNKDKDYIYIFNMLNKKPKNNENNNKQINNKKKKNQTFQRQAIMKILKNQLKEQIQMIISKKRKKSQKKNHQKRKEKDKE